jgi:hypothetical protein
MPDPGRQHHDDKDDRHEGSGGDLHLTDRRQAAVIINWLDSTPPVATSSRASAARRQDRLAGEGAQLDLHRVRALCMYLQARGQAFRACLSCGCPRGYGTLTVGPLFGPRLRGHARLAYLVLRSLLPPLFTSSAGPDASCGLCPSSPASAVAMTDERLLSRCNIFDKRR